MAASVDSAVAAIPPVTLPDEPAAVARTREATDVASFFVPIGATPVLRRPKVGVYPAWRISQVHVRSLVLVRQPGELGR